MVFYHKWTGQHNIVPGIKYKGRQDTITVEYNHMSRFVYSTFDRYHEWRIHVFLFCTQGWGEDTG